MPSLTRAWTEDTCLRPEAEEQLSVLREGPGLLTPGEQVLFKRLATDKRRLDWLCGRIAAKRVLGAYLSSAPRDVEILNEPSGRPYCTNPGAPAFSITHTALGGLAAASPLGPIGVDWEMVRARGAEVIAFYTHESERDPCASAAAQTRLWAVKEAVLKLLGIGLASDPRDVRVLPELSLHGSALRRWRELGAPPISLWEKTLPDSVIAVAFTGGPHGHREE